MCCWISATGFLSSAGGKGNGMLDGRTATKEQVGLLMTNLKNGGGES